MKRKLLPYLIFLILWVIASVLYFFAAETITVWLFPGFHTVQYWLIVLITGLVLIFIIALTLLVINRTRKKI